jgi:uncharacterized protein (TIGR00251 family)
MLLKIKVITKSSQNKIGDRVGDKLKVYVTAPPEKGKANEMVIRLIAEWLSVSKSKVKIVSGLFSQSKIVKIETNDS